MLGLYCNSVSQLLEFRLLLDNIRKERKWQESRFDIYMMRKNYRNMLSVMHENVHTT